jgi:hypothetical protein
MTAAKKNPDMTFEERVAIATAPGWVPAKTGETTIKNATVIGFRTYSHEEYGDRPVVVYRKEDGTYISVYALHAVILERYKELKPVPGDVHNIMYLGRQTSNTRVDAKGEPQEYESVYVEKVGDEASTVATEFPF